MREIKFRVWWNGMMLEVLNLDFAPMYFLGYDEKSDECWEFPNEEVSLMQYTGLKDKNGVEIYDGDIVARIEKSVYHFVDRKNWKPEDGIWIDKQKVKSPYLDENYIHGRLCEVVKWQDDLTGFYPFADCPENCGHCGSGENPLEYEVIGNIHENKDLLL